jgi:hypothetical protein
MESQAGGDPLSEKLRDVYAKLDWADKHIADLHSRIRAYFHSRPPAVSGEIEFDFDRNTVDWSGIIFVSVQVSDTVQVVAEHGEVPA